MATHTITLFSRSQSSAPALASTYPTSLASGESLLYDAGGAEMFPLQVRVARGGSGNASVVKVQAAALPVDGANFAVRGPGAEQGLLQVFGLTGDFYTVQLQQQVGQSQPYSVTATGTAGLDLALLVLLPTDDTGLGIGTPADAAAAIVAAYPSDFLAVASGSGQSIGRLGSTMDKRPAGRVHWNDVTSFLQGAEAVEHTITPATGTTVDVELELRLRGVLAVRALAKGAAAPAAGDSVTILAAVEGA